MTAHQDVAGVVERLRKHVQDRGGFAKDDNGVPVGTAWPMMLEAATLIESLSKALSEAEAERDRWAAQSLKEDDCRQGWQNRAEAAESRLAEAMKLLDYVSSFQVSEELDKTGKFSDVCKAWIERKKSARRFLNAWKE